MVCAKKPNGDLCVCMNAKDLNAHIETEHYQDLNQRHEVTSEMASFSPSCTYPRVFGNWNCMKIAQSSPHSIHNFICRYSFWRMSFGISSTPEAETPPVQTTLEYSNRYSNLHNYWHPYTLLWTKCTWSLFHLYILLFKDDHLIHDFLFHWGINIWGDTKTIFRHIPINMGKISAGNQIQIKCWKNVLSFISQGMAIKIATRLKIPISIVRAILKKFKATVTVTNLPGRGPMLIPPPHAQRGGW